MSEQEQDPMVDEFDTVASWTADAVAELGDEYALAAACRGSGGPAALDWLATTMGVTAGSLLLDSGAGVGGPAEYVARSTGATPVLTEPMAGACRAARDLFDNPVVAADGLALPFAPDSFDCAWSLGVLCTLEDKAAYLRELARVVRAGGAVGLLVYTRAVDDLPNQPEGNWFPTRGDLEELLDGAGLTLLAETLLTDVEDTPEDWQGAAKEVEDLIEERHAGDERWQRAQTQQDTIGALISDGSVVGVLLTGRVRRAR